MRVDWGGLIGGGIRFLVTRRDFDEGLGEIEFFFLSVFFFM